MRRSYVPYYTTMLIDLSHNDFSPSGEQLEQSILAHKLKQPTAICIAIFVATQSVGIS